MAIMRGITLLDPVIQEVNLTVPDPMKWFRLEEEMLNLGLGDREVNAIVRETMDTEAAISLRCLTRKWRLEDDHPSGT